MTDNKNTVYVLHVWHAKPHTTILLHKQSDRDNSATTFRADQKYATICGSKFSHTMLDNVSDVCN